MSDPPIAVRFELAKWRDAAVVLLALEVLLLDMLLMAACYLALRVVRWFQGQVKPILLKARLYTWRASQLVMRIMHTVAAPIIWLQSAREGLRRALDILGWR